jgi:hypothetical protein
VYLVGFNVTSTLKEQENQENGSTAEYNRMRTELSGTLAIEEELDVSL